MVKDKLERIFEIITPIFLISILLWGISWIFYIIEKCRVIFGWQHEDMAWQNYCLWATSGFFFIMLILILSPIGLAYLKNWVKKVLQKYENIIGENNNETK